MTKLVDIILPVFVLVLAGVYFGFTRKEAAAYAHRLANADAPWRWRPEWCTPAIASTDGSQTGSLVRNWLLTLLWNGVSWVAIYSIATSDIERGPWLMLLAFLSVFAIVGLVLLISASRSQLRRVRYGVPRFVPMSLPGVICSQLRGSIEIPSRLSLRANDHVDLVLRCVRQVVTGVHNNRKVTETTVWESVQHLAAGRLRLGKHQTSLPVEFDIPPGLPESSWSYDGANGAMLWRLIARAASPGAELRVSIFVPVFMTETSRALSADAEASDGGMTVPLAPEVSPQFSSPSH